MGGAADTHHGTAVALGGLAALIVGPSGSGKSDLALRCLTLAPTELIPEPAVLIADDRVHIEAVSGRLRVNAPETLLGQLEVRGLGIVPVPFRWAADLVLIAEIAAAGSVERLPDPPLWRDLLGIGVPVLRICPFEASAPSKLLLALMQTAQTQGGGQNS
ncbi:MAG: HPr kinase/phosphatase C-terminal domain-containing protein [Hyphomicrobium sp.]